MSGVSVVSRKQTRPEEAQLTPTPPQQQQQQQQPVAPSSLGTEDGVAASPPVRQSVEARQSAVQRHNHETHAVARESEIQNLFTARNAASDPTRGAPSATAETEPSRSFNPLVAPGGIAVRGEFRGAPIDSRKALESYGGLTADQLNGPDDLRLKQIHRTVQRSNVETVRNISSAAQAEGLTDLYVGGRAKTPESIFGKLRKEPGARIADVSDMSGLRLELDPTKTGFTELEAGREVAQAGVGDELRLWKDYTKQPTDWGYTGRVHYDSTNGTGIRQEVQVGIKDMSRFIDRKLVTQGGDQISLHDVTGYKGKVYGVELPDALNKQYGQIMGKINEVAGQGKTVSQTPALEAEISTFYRDVEKHLPDRINQSVTTSEISSSARNGMRVARGLGVLSVAGGAAQIAEGIDQVKNGDPIEGSANVSAGTGAIGSGGLMLAGRMVAGTSVGGAVAVVDGARDIYAAVRDRDVERGVVGSVKTGAGAAMMVGAATLNPVLIGAGAIAYGGAVVYENWDTISKAITG